METLEQFIVVIPTLVALCVGWLVKHVIPSDAVNRFIPLIAAWYPALPAPACMNCLTSL